MNQNQNNFFQNLKKNLINTIKSFKQDKPSSSSIPMQPYPTNVNQQKNLLIPTSKSKKRNYKKIFTLAGLLVLCMILFLPAIIYVTNLDLSFVKLEVVGRVSDQNGNPVREAKIYINDTEITTTNNVGRYKVSGFRQGNYKIKVIATSFEEVEQDLTVKKGFFNYTTTRDFVLISKGEATLSGTIKKPTENYDFSNDRILIGVNRYNIKEDGTFFIEGLVSGDTTFTFESVNFIDISEQINLQKGNNTIAEIITIPAGDIDGKLISYVKEDPIQNVTIQINNTTDDQITIDYENSTFKIKDLEINRSYNIRITGAGYKTRDYEVTIRQGSNAIFEQKFVEDETAYFLNRATGGQYLHFSKSDLDGLNYTNINNNPDLQPINFYLDENENRLYFQSYIDRVRAVVGQQIKIIYYIDLQNLSVNRVTTQVNGISELIPNYKAKKAINITAPDRSSSDKIIEIVNLDGSSRNSIKTVRDKDVLQAFLSANGKTTFTLEGTRRGSKELYITEADTKSSTRISTKEDIQIHAVSEDGNRVVYTAKDSSQNFDDLLMFDKTTNETRTLKVNSQGTNYQFLNGSNNTLIYIDEVNRRKNIYALDIEQRRTNQVTRLGLNDKLQNFYQQLEYIFYITSDGLFVTDFVKPNTYKLVLEGQFTPGYKN